MNKITPLHYTMLRKKLDPKELGFETTAELEKTTDFVGQERALKALNFGIGIKNQGFNLYAMGPTGLGKHSFVMAVLKDHVKKSNPPSDWCYIHNFDDPVRPLALQLPRGLGTTLQQDMNTLIEEINSSILAIFESDVYNRGMQKILDGFKTKRKKFKKTKNNDEEFEEEEKVPALYKERHDNEKKLQYKFAYAAIHPLIRRLKVKYRKYRPVVKHLKAIENDILNRLNDFIKRDEITHIVSINCENPNIIKYQINLLVDNAKLKRAPIIYEANPSYYNLIGRTEHVSIMGTLETNFTLIKPGALHKANGGYLIIEARKLKKSPHALEGLKRVLFARKIKIEPIEDTTEMIRPVSLTPEPIPLDVKVIILGKRSIYYSLIHKDPDFSELFKVAVDFDNQIPRNKKNIQAYARLIGTIAQKKNLRPFHATAVAAIIDHSSRVAEDAEKLSAYMTTVDDLICESDFWAGTKNKKYVEAIDVKRAIDAQNNRLDRTQEENYEEIVRQFVLINTKDDLIGQVNCLSVVQVGNFSYGHPTRLTARVRAGNGELIDIQHKIKLAGPMHTKSGLVISNFLASYYFPDRKYALNASLSFEQIYGKLEGDSASIGELCAIISAIAEIPIKQSLAVTGSVNQEGDVQAIGGVNEKIEGFFYICKAKGLNGKQGVVIPKVNVSNLMLHEDVVKAIKHKQFFIYTIERIEEAIFLLMGLAAGKRLKDGKFPQNTVNFKVEERLENFYYQYRKVVAKKY